MSDLQARPWWREGLFSVSIANLAMINVWQLLLYSSESDRYFLPEWHAAHFGAALILLAALTLGIWLCVAWIRRIDRIVVTVAGQLCVAVLLVNVLEQLRDSFGITRLELLGAVRALPLVGHLAIGAVIAASVGFGVARYWAVSRAAFVAVLIMSPLAMSNLVQVVWRGANASALPSPPDVAIASAEASNPSLQPAQRRRVLWIIFDEFDYRLAFQDRPEFVDLPQFDRLRGESFWASEALEPAGHTGTSIPSFLIGKPVTAGKPISADRFDLRFDLRADLHLDLRLDQAVPRQRAMFGEQATFFSRVHERGLRLGIVGIYHPYCRLFEGLYQSCHFDPFLPGGGVGDLDSFSGILTSQAYKLVPVLSYRGEHIASIERTVDRGAIAAADPALDAVFLHLPIPHSPYVYDSDKREMTVWNFGANAYYQQLELADRSFGTIRRAMEASGVWNDTIVMVTSDHGWRFARRHGTQRDHRVPFVVKVPHQTEPLHYEDQVETWRAGSLLLAMLSGEIADSNGIARWLDRQIDERANPTLAETNPQLADAEAAQN